MLPVLLILNYAILPFVFLSFLLAQIGILEYIAFFLIWLWDIRIQLSFWHAFIIYL